MKSVRIRTRDDSISLTVRTLADANIIHFHSFWSLFILGWMGLAILSGKKIVLSPRGMLRVEHLNGRPLKKILLWLFVRRMLRSVDAWHFQHVTERESCAVYIEDRLLVVDGNGVDIPAIKGANGGDLSDVFPNREVANLVFLGRIHPIKGVDFQIYVIKELVDRGLPVVLNLFGEDDGCLEDVIELARALGISDRIKICGPVYSSEKFKILTAADAVLLTSIAENNSNVAVETIASGGILVATDSCNLDHAGEAGACIVVERDVASVVDALCDILLFDVGRRELRRRARDYADANLAWGEKAIRMLDLYDLVLGDSEN